MAFQSLYPEKMEEVRSHIRETYRKQGKELSGITLEVACFKAIPFGKPLKGEFCISLALMRWPFLYVEQDGIENYWFTRMMRALCVHPVLYLIGSASSGKTFTSSVWGMNMWGTDPFRTKLIVTSTSKNSLEQKVWGAIRTLHEKDVLKIGVRVDYQDAIVMGEKANQRDLKASIQAMALPSGSEGRRAIGELQGMKNDRMIWIRDEYDHMDSFVNEAGDNLLANDTLGYHQISCSNRPVEGGPMWKEAMPNPEEFPMGWETPELSELEGWRTASGAYCLYFDGEKSPNTLATGEKDPFPRMTSRKYIAAMRAKGEDSLGWWMYIKSFPQAGSVYDRLLSAKVLERYEATSAPVWAGTQWVWLCGLDPSWTKGGDACVADFGRVGTDFRGIKILAHETETVKLNAKVSGVGTYEEQLSEVFLDECAKRDCHVVAIDISGSGGRVANAIRNCATKRNYKLEILTVDSAGSPDESEMYSMGDMQKNGKQAFDRRVSELWYAYRLDVEAGLIRGVSLTSKATKELCDRRISTDSEKRFEIEKKDDYKKRNNGRSPDHAEARILLRFAARRHGLGASVIPKQTSQRVSLGILTGEEKPKSAYGWGRGKSAYSY